MWRELGIGSIGDLYIGGTFATFKQLQEKFKLQKNHFFRYLQIRNYVKTHLTNFETVTPNTLENSIKCFARSHSRISHLYDALLSLGLPKTDTLKDKWETELGIPISQFVWEECLEYIHECSINTRHCLIQFKILHRLHYSKVKLHKIFPDVSPLCEKCECSEATLSHSYALCHKLWNYWGDIFNFLSRILEVQINPDPVLIILGISDELLKLNVAQQRLLSYGVITAKKLILLNWKEKEVSSFKHWLSDQHSPPGENKIHSKGQTEGV